MLSYFEGQEGNTQNLNNVFFPVFLHPTLWFDKTSCTNNVKLHKPQPNHSNPVWDSGSFSIWNANGAEFIFISYVIVDISNVVPEMKTKYYPDRETLIFSLKDRRQIRSLEKWQLSPTCLYHSLSKLQTFSLFDFPIFHPQYKTFLFSRNC